MVDFHCIYLHRWTRMTLLFYWAIFIYFLPKMHLKERKKFGEPFGAILLQFTVSFCIHQIQLLLRR